MEISLIAVDMDGTFLNDNSAVTAENLAAVRRLSKKGILTVPVTGRTYNEIPAAVRNEECIKYFVFSNGAGIYEKGKGITYVSVIPKETAGGIFSLLDSYETFTEIYSGGYPWAIGDKVNEESFEYYRINPRFRKIIAHSRKKVDNFSEMIRSGSLQPELFDAFFRNAEERIECLEKLKKMFPEEEVVSSLGNNLEIMNKGTHKGTGLEQLCEILSLDISKTLALGDSKNDIQLFQTAGVSYAVSNACDELKKMATGTICSNNENVMEFVEKNIL